MNSIKILKNQFFEVFFSETKIKLENEKIGIAFSGGSDSLALLFLLHKFSKKNNFQIISMIVDHGLREDSKSESIQAKKISEDIGVKAEIYRWNGIKPGSALMKKARDIRYELLLKGCNNLGIKKLCLAHNFDDQIETYYMRKKRSIFNYGLSCMDNVTIRNDILLLRPFLKIQKQILENTCKANNLKWINDPSNTNPKFERVRTRNKLKTIDFKKKIEMESNISYFKKKKKELDDLFRDFLKDRFFFQAHGVFRLNKNKLASLKESIQIEVIRRILKFCSGKIFYPSYKSSHTLLKKILDEKVKNCTLHSCIINLVKNEIIICREYRKTHLNMNNVVIVKPNEEKLWDYRFVVKSKFKKLRLKKIDHENWKFVKEYFFSNCKRKLKAPIIKTLPLVKFESNYLIPFVSEKKEFLENGINFYFKNFI